MEPGADCRADGKLGSAVPGSSAWGDIRSRAEGLSIETVQRIMGNSEVHPESLSGGLRSKGWGFSRVPASDLQFPGEFLSGLRCDRWYHCPDSLDGMSEAYGVSRQVEQLRGSTVCRLPSAQQLKAIERLHRDLKQESRDAWATEAVMKGIDLAKDGHYSKARAFYDQALNLKPDNVDALVAKGASYANQSRLQEAVAHFQRALDINPDHGNAAGYLEATKKKLEAQGTRASPAQQRGRMDPGSRAASSCNNNASAADTPAPQQEAPGGKKAFEAELQEALATAKRKQAKKDRKSGASLKDKSLPKDKKRRKN